MTIDQTKVIPVSGITHTKVNKIWATSNELPGPILDRTNYGVPTNFLTDKTTTTHLTSESMVANRHKTKKQILKKVNDFHFLTSEVDIGLPNKKGIQE